MSSSSSSSFDPLSSSSTTGSIMVTIALFCLCLAAFNLGKQRNNKAESIYQVSWWSIPSAICLFLAALSIFFAYD